MNRLDAHLKQHGSVDGEALFHLHDTYGCPPDLILDILRERGQAFDPAQMKAYDALMTRQRERARAASKFAGGAGLPGEVLGTLSPTQICGYDTLVAPACTVLARSEEHTSELQSLMRRSYAV